MKLLLSFSLVMALCISSEAQTCAERLDGMKERLARVYAFDEVREVVKRVDQAMTTEERTTLEDFSRRFRERKEIRLQFDASRLIRAVAARAGYKRELGDSFVGIYGVPVRQFDDYDAVVAQYYWDRPMRQANGSIKKDSTLDYVIEVRVLMTRDARPRAALRWDSIASNKPFDAVSMIEFTADGEERARCGGEKVKNGPFVGTLDECLKALLPEECRPEVTTP